MPPSSYSRRRRRRAVVPRHAVRQWAGAAPGGFDCSGLVMYAYSQVGVSLPHSSYAHVERRRRRSRRTSSSRATSSSSTASATSGIYIGGGQFVHAPHTGDVVQVSSLDSGSYASRTSAPAASPSAPGSPAGARLARARIQGVPRLDFACTCAQPGTDRSASASSASPSGSRRRRRRPRGSRTSQFRMLHRECLTPIKQKRWCPVHDVEVAPDELVRGWEVGEGPVHPGRGRGARGDRAARHLARDRDHALRRRPTRSTRSTSTAPTSSCPAGTEAQRRPVRAAARGDARGRASSASARSCSPARRSSA